MTIDAAVISNAVSDIQGQRGIAVLDLPQETAELHRSCFETAKRAFDVVEQNPESVYRIKPSEDSAHVTGYHPASIEEGMSRYNAHRRGFVFSDNNMLSVDGVGEFQEAMQQFYKSLHGVALQILCQMETQWKLPEGWFQSELGPTLSNSQWHVKQFAPPPQNENGDFADWLPPHTDPSLISIVVHDAPGKQEGALGLQYQKIMGKEKQWVDVPHHGHLVATILCGSVMSYVTGTTIHAAKHRVMFSSLCNDSTRMAATLFVRPRKTSSLIVPPSPLFSDVRLKKTSTFHEWSARVSRNYMKKQKKPPVTNTKG